MQQHFKIVGTGHYRPATVVSVEEMDRRLNKPRGWTRVHAGGGERRECLPRETLAGMARRAIERALQDANVTWPEVDALIDCSTCRQQPIPCNASLVQAEFGDAANGIPCFDIQSTCLGFILALQVANGLLAAGSHRRIVLVASEASLSGVNWREPESASLMSDGAAAAIVERHSSPQRLHFAHETYAEHADVCEVLGGGHKLSPFDYCPDLDDKFRFHMDGPRLFRIARRLLPPMVQAIFNSSAFQKEDVFVIPHQASPRAVEKIRRVLGIAPSHYADRVSEFGNMIAASIPMILDLYRRDGRIKEGDPVMLLGTSAGYSQAAMVFKL
ncbi:MAG: 3-oxoacyl-[acyl-carrier-protein] synthase III C-terminal domain-containing protein [Planctomycetota bacterium]